MVRFLHKVENMLKGNCFFFGIKVLFESMAAVLTVNFPFNTTLTL